MRDERRKTWSGGKRWLLCLLSPVSCLPLLLLATPAVADSEKWYQVEVIIFQQQDHYQQEQPRRDLILNYPYKHLELIDPTAPADDEADNLSPAERETVIEVTPETSIAPEQPFVMLAESERQLNTQATTLRRRSGYRVLYHQAWRQPGIASIQAPWILIRTGDRFGEHFELEGSLRLVLDNYLHLETDLWLSRFAENFGQEAEIWPALPDYPIVEAELEPTEQDNTSLSQKQPPLDSTTNESDFPLTLPDTGELPFGEAPSPYLTTKIDAFNTSRKLRLDELHYLDHPRMGILVRVNRYELPEMEEGRGEVLGATPN